MWELDYKEDWGPKNWCSQIWRKFLIVPWTTGRSTQSILKEITPEYSLEGLTLKLKLYSGHLMRTANSLEKTLMLRKTEGKRRMGQQRMMALERRQLDDITDSVDMNVNKSRRWWWTGEAWHAVAHGFTKTRTWLSNWTTTHLEHKKFVLKEALIFYLVFVSALPQKYRLP